MAVRVKLGAVYDALPAMLMGFIIYGVGCFWQAVHQKICKSYDR